MSRTDLKALWNEAPSRRDKIDPARLAELPGAAYRYLARAIQPDAPPAGAVRLLMRGEIRLKSWVPFEAEQVIRPERGMIWRATARVRGVPVRGYDRIVDGRGEMRWRLLGLLPVLARSGPDIDRSAAGRLAAELVWLPSALAGSDVAWSEPEPSVAAARFAAQGFPHELRLALGPDGEPREIRIRRWGDPDGGAFREEEFGGLVEEVRRFGAFTIPVRLRIGWHPGTERFAGEGEFFRVTVTDAEHR